MLKSSVDVAFAGMFRASCGCGIIGKHENRSEVEAKPMGNVKPIVTVEPLDSGDLALATRGIRERDFLVSFPYQSVGIADRQARCMKKEWILRWIESGLGDEKAAALVSSRAGDVRSAGRDVGRCAGHVQESIRHVRFGVYHVWGHVLHVKFSIPHI